MTSKMPVLKTKDVINRFKSWFGDFVEGNSDPNNNKAISQFTTSLKKIINNLGNLSLKALALSEAYDLYS